MSKGMPPRDPNYDVVGLPIGIKGMITKFASAAADYAYLGAAPPEDWDAIEEGAQIARYNLECVIDNKLREKDRQIEKLKKVLKKVAKIDGRGAAQPAQMHEITRISRSRPISGPNYHAARRAAIVDPSQEVGTFRRPASSLE